MDLFEYVQKLLCFCVSQVTKYKGLHITSLRQAVDHGATAAASAASAVPPASRLGPKLRPHRQLQANGGRNLLVRRPGRHLRGPGLRIRECHSL